MSAGPKNPFQVPLIPDKQVPLILGSKNAYVHFFVYRKSLKNTLFQFNDDLTPSSFLHLQRRSQRSPGKDWCSGSPACLGREELCVKATGLCCSKSCQNGRRRCRASIGRVVFQRELPFDADGDASVDDFASDLVEGSHDESLLCLCSGFTLASALLA